MSIKQYTKYKLEEFDKKFVKDGKVCEEPQKIKDWISQKLQAIHFLIKDNKL